MLASILPLCISVYALTLMTLMVNFTIEENGKPISTFSTSFMTLLAMSPEFIDCLKITFIVIASIGIFSFALRHF